MKKELVLELKRKGLHLFAIFVPISMLFFSSNISLIIITMFSISAVIIDLLRIKNQNFAKIYSKYFGGILRAHEENGKFTGATFFFISLMASYLIFNTFFSMPIEYTVSIYVAFMLGDASAALVGKFLGKIKIYRSKTLEGFLACFFTGVSVVYLVFGSDLLLMLLIPFIISLLELLIDKLDDNLVVPFLSLVVVKVVLL